MALDICFDVTRTCRACSRFFPEDDEQESIGHEKRQSMQFYHIFHEAANTNDSYDVKLECSGNENGVNARPSDEIKDIYEELVIWKLNIKPNDNLPQQICYDCLIRFRNVKAFREECLDTQKVLESYFKDFENLLETGSFGRISPKADSVKSDDTRSGFNTNKALNDATTTPPRNQRQLSPIFASSPRLMLGSPNYNDLMIYTENSIGTPPPLFEEIKTAPSFDLQNMDIMASDDDLGQSSLSLEPSDASTKQKATAKVQYDSSDDESSTPTSDEEDNDAEGLNDDDDDGETVSATSQFTQRSDTNSLYESRNSLQCKICSAAFNSRSMLRQHRVRAHPQEKPYVCNICTSSFKTNFMLRQHKVRHNRPDTTKCDLCSKYFRSQLHLQRHTKNFHLTSTYTCHICHEKFENYTQMRFQYHVRQHGEKRFQCQYCDKSFHQKTHLLNHTRGHTKEQPFHCNICGKAYRLQSACREHMLTHEDPSGTPFKCEVCFKGFTQKSSLRLHFYRFHESSEEQKQRKKQQKATKQQHYLCKFCGQSFGQKLHWEMHELSHAKSTVKAVGVSRTKIHNKFSKRQVHKCKICGKAFNLETTLKLHMKSTHSSKSHIYHNKGGGRGRFSELDASEDVEAEEDEDDEDLSDYTFEQAV